MQFYRNEKPNFEDFAMVKITGYSENLGLYCELLEYNNISAVIMKTEISKYKLNYSKKFPIGKIFPCMIYEIDSYKDYINLSYKRLTEPTIEKLEADYVDKLHLYKLFHELDHFLENNFDKAYVSNMLWDCMEYVTENDITHKKYYEELLDNPQLIFNFDKENRITQDNRATIISSLDSRIKKTDITVELQFSLLILENNFMDKIKNIFDIGERVQCVSSPIYSIVLSGKTVDETKETFTELLIKLKDKLSNTKHDLKFDISNIKIIKERFFSMSYIKPLI
jgi:translation initiation factor 2 alpha subunit (eIF-2alpha)